MIKHSDITDQRLRQVIRNSTITYAGNSKLAIFGKLNCTSGKRMKKLNRVFFTSAAEARDTLYRPCGNCMKQEYKQWRNEFIQSGRTY